MNLFARRTPPAAPEHACAFAPNPGETTAFLSVDGTGIAVLEEVVSRHGDAVATIRQDPGLDPLETIGAHLSGRHRVDEIATSLGLVGREHERLGELGPAMQQRVQVCRELASNAELVAAFDPFVELDERDARMLQVVLRACAVECRRSVVYATKDAETASRAHRAVVLKGGRIVADVRGASAPELAGHLG